MAHDVPLDMAPPDEYDDLISGTCSHLPQKEKLRNVVFFISGQMTLKTITVVTFEYLMNVKKI
uniref:hypothetical protein n=1 Tax=Enterobacter cloacae complex sp. 280C5 TaxID=3395861 RepID=UPI003CF95234